MIRRVSAAFEPHERIFGPTYGLDHRLFEGERMRPQVRAALLDRLAPVMAGALGDRWTDVARAWLAGSEASKWTGPDLEGNGDIDILIGVDYPRARRSCPDLAGLTDTEIDERLNVILRAQFAESHWHPPWDRAGKEYDLTGYVNHDSWDIRDLRPYAAYDLAANTWAVEPPDLPRHLLSDFEPGILAQARAVTAEARAILRLPARLRAAQALLLWERIHEARRRAFSPAGEGWEDPGNVTEKWLDQAPGHVLDRLRDTALGAA